MEFDKINRQISGCESLIMKIIWDADYDVSTPELMDSLHSRFGKNYARTTVVTFLQRLIQKGYVETYRKGRIAYVHPLKDEQEFIKNYFDEAIDLWLNGDVEKLLELYR